MRGVGWWTLRTLQAVEGNELPLPAGNHGCIAGATCQRRARVKHGALEVDRVCIEGILAYVTGLGNVFAPRSGEPRQCAVLINSTSTLTYPRKTAEVRLVDHLELL